MDITKLHLHWRASSHKGNTYRSYSLAHGYRADGKNRKKIVVKLGKLSDEEVTRWRRLLKALKKPDNFIATDKDIVVTDHFYFLDVVVANAVWDHWKLNEAFRTNGRKHVDSAIVARILAVNRCIDPASKSQVPEWFGKTVLPRTINIHKNSINSSRIFRELEVIEDQKEEICEHLYQKISGNNPESMSSVFYDLSSTTFTGSKCVLMKWGHCKEGYRNHVVLAIVVNNVGLPFYWEVLPGGTADATTVIWLLDRLKKRFEVEGTTLVFDRGMVSDDNLALIEGNNIKYISAMDKSQIEGISGIDFSAFSYFDPKRIEAQINNLSDFSVLDKNTYYQEIKVDGKRRYILCFNQGLFKDERAARQRAVANFLLFAKNLNDELSEAKKSRQQEPTLKKFKRELVKHKLTRFVNINLQSMQIIGKSGAKKKINTYHAKVTINEEDMRLAGKLDGFWLLVTNHSKKEDGSFVVSAEKTIKPYRDKVVIESSFRDIKSFVEVAPVFVWTEAHVKAHYTICVLSHLINRTLTLRLHNNKGDFTKDIVSHEKLYSTLSNCMIDRIKIESADISIDKITQISSVQNELLNRIGMQSLVSSEVKKSQNITC